MEPISAPRRLRQMLADPSKTVVAPGVYDGISTRLALAQGFDCLYMVSLGGEINLYRNHEASELSRLRLENSQQLPAPNISD